jgi:simple sugar transport system ATP-binding protein
MVPALETRGIVKRYGAVLANDGIDLAVARGEVHAVMGENGAGKSTLMGILYGLHQPDAGTILLDGRPVRLRSPAAAIASGLGMVHQAFKLFASLTVWQNIVYASEPRRFLLIDRAAARRAVAALAGRYGLAVDPDATVGRLSVGVCQRVEILKALYRDARILILDEPTAVLTPRERDALFAVLRRLVADGRSVLFVTHKLDEVLAVSAHVTVLREGRVAARLITRDTSAREIVRAMTGHGLGVRPARATMERGPARLEADAITLHRDGGRRLVDAVRFAVHAGEIVGIAGVAGNGQAELTEMLFGLRRPDGGRVRVNGRDVTAADVAAHREAGLACIPEDRAAVGTAPAASAAENLAMGFQRAPPLARFWWLDVTAMRAWARALIARFGIRIADERTAAGTLSGGNLQKLVLARELAHAAPVLIAEQPTRGLDVGATEFVHAELLAARARGCAVLLISAELSEILALSDRVLVMYEGRIAGEVAAARADEETLGLLMAGRVAAAA